MGQRLRKGGRAAWDWPSAWVRCLGLGLCRSISVNTNSPRITWWVGVTDSRPPARKFLLSCLCPTPLSLPEMNIFRLSLNRMLLSPLLLFWEHVVLVMTCQRALARGYFWQSMVATDGCLFFLTQIYEFNSTISKLLGKRVVFILFPPWSCYFLARCLMV